jgi:uncharacterized membrane protein
MAQRLASRVGELARREPALTALVCMAVAGVSISLYLTGVHYLNVPLACSTSGVVDCAPVLQSTYSVVPGTQLPITVPGLLWFVASGTLAGIALARAWAGRPGPRWLRPAHAAWGAAGLLAVLYLVYAEIVQLHRICAWCTVVHLLTLATFLVALARLQQLDMPPAAASPTPQPRQRPQRGRAPTARRNVSPSPRRAR